MSMTGTAEPIGDPVAVARTMTLTLLAARATGATVCPSEVARALAAGDPSSPAWRDLMPTVHLGVDLLLAEGTVRLSWKGQALSARAVPYRIGKG